MNNCLEKSKIKEAKSPKSINEGLMSMVDCASNQGYGLPSNAASIKSLKQKVSSILMTR